MNYRQLQQLSDTILNQASAYHEITFEEVMDGIGAYDLQDDELDYLIAYLNDHGVRLVSQKTIQSDQSNSESIVTEEERISDSQVSSDNIETNITFGEWVKQKTEESAQASVCNIFQNVGQYLLDNRVIKDSLLMSEDSTPIE